MKTNVHNVQISIHTDERAFLTVSFIRGETVRSYAYYKHDGYTGGQIISRIARVQRALATTLDGRSNNGTD